MQLFKSEKQPRYPRERQLPADVMPQQINNTVCLNASTGADFFSSSPSGYPVTETTAMRVAAVYACVEKICVIASLPKHIYQRTDNGAERIDHDYWAFLNTQPDDNWTAASLWERTISSMLLRGDGIIEIRRPPKTGHVIGLKPYLWDNTSILRDHKGVISYRVTDPHTRQQKILLADEVLHIPGFGFNGWHGMSVIQYAAYNGVGIALAANQYSSEFFANGINPDIVLATDQTLNQKQTDDLKQQIENKHAGIGNRHKPLILQGGLKVQQVSLSSEDAQLLQTREFQVVDLCTAFGVPPQLIGAKESVSGWAGASLEQVNIFFAKYTLKGHIARIEQEINRKLFPGNSKIFVKFNMDAFLDGDSKSQAEYFAKALGGPGQQGFMYVNEVRKLKNLPPLSDPAYDQVIISGSKPQETNNAPASA